MRKLIQVLAIGLGLAGSSAFAATDTFTETETETATETSTSTATATSTSTSTSSQTASATPTATATSTSTSTSSQTASATPTSTATRTATCASNCFAYVAIEKGQDLAVINTSAHVLSATVRNIGYGANGIVFSGATGYASVTGQPGFLKVFSTTTNKLTGAFGLGTFPEQVAVSPNGSYVAVPNADGFAQGTVHLVQGAHVTEVLAGTQPFACAFTPNGSFLYVTNYNSGASSTVTVIDVASRTVRHQIGVGRGARFVDFNFAGTRAYVANEQSGSVSVINTSTNKVVATVATGGFPYFVTANNARTFVTLRNTGGGVATILQSNNSFVVARTGDKPTFCVTKAKSGSDNEGWVANTGSANVKHFTGTTVNRVLSTGAGTHPLHIAWALNSYNDSGEILYVTLYDQAGKVIAVKPSDDSLLATLSVGPFPKFVAVKP